MNPKTNGNDLSAYLQGIVKQGGLEKEVAVDFNELPSLELQEQALDIYSDNAQVGKLIVRHLLNQASGKVINEALPAPAAPTVSAAPPEPVALASPHGHIKTALHSMEKYAAWEILSELESWMAVQVPPYRYVRKVFSWACTAFSVETVLAFLISLAMLYGGYRLVSAGVKWGWQEFHHVSAPPQPVVVTPQQTMSMVNPPLPPRERVGERVPDVDMKRSAPSPSHVPSVPLDLSREGRGNTTLARHDTSQNVSSNKYETAQTQSTAQKPSFLSAFTKNLLNNADGAVASAIPIAPVSQGVIAVKNAAVTAEENSATRNAQREQNKDALPIARTALRPSVPVPTGLTYQPIDGGHLRFMWNTAGAGYRYNLYASLPEPVAFTYNDPENSAPMTENVVVWNAPSDKGKRFIFELRTLDAQGRESASSNRVEGDLP